MIVDIHGHRFEIFTLVSEIHENVDLVLGIKNICKLEGVLYLHESYFNFLNPSIPFFSKEQLILKPKEQKLFVVEALFIEEILGMAIVKRLDKGEQIAVMLKLKFIRNRVTLNVTNNTQETVTFAPKEMKGVLDLRSLGYWKIKQGMLQQNFE